MDMLYIAHRQDESKFHKGAAYKNVQKYSNQDSRDFDVSFGDVSMSVSHKNHQSLSGLCLESAYIRYDLRYFVTT